MRERRERKEEGAVEKVRADGECVTPCLVATGGDRLKETCRSSDPPIVLAFLLSLTKPSRAWPCYTTMIFNSVDCSNSMSLDDGLRHPCFKVRRFTSHKSSG